IQLLSPVNASEVQPGGMVIFSVTDLSLKQVTGSWDDGSVFEVTNQSRISIPGTAGSHSLTLLAFDLVGHNTSKRFIWTVVISLDVSTQRTHSIIYEGMTEIFSIKLTNPYNVSLTLRPVILAPDDKVEGYPTEITIPAGENYWFNFSVTPKHASQHVITIRFFSSEVLVYEQVFLFDVNPLYLHPIVLTIGAIIIVIFIIISSIFLISRYKTRKEKFWTTISCLNRFVEENQNKGKKWVRYSRLLEVVQYEVDPTINYGYLDGVVKKLIKYKIVSEPVDYGGVKHLPTWVVAHSSEFKDLLKLAEKHAGLVDLPLVIKELNWTEAEAKMMLHWSSTEGKCSKFFSEPSLWLFTHEHQRAPIIKEILEMAKKQRGEFRREWLMNKYTDVSKMDQILLFLEKREIAVKEKTLDGLIWHFPAFSNECIFFGKKTRKKDNEVKRKLGKKMSKM
ncbi:MAG: hypothetical protein ACFFDT_32245, partial [Candidatus Hodarchaeota archaeon]